MEKKKIVVFGDLPIATKVVQWIRSVEELELIGCVVSKPDAHNNDPWKDTPMLKEYCKENHIKVFQNSSELKELYKTNELDLGLSCRFSKILKKDIIDLFRIGIINMHGGLLPEFGGPYSCNYSILFGEGKGGGTIHWIDENIDTGDIIRRCEFDILPEDTSYDVFQKTQYALYENLIEVVLPIIKGELSDFISQQELINNGYVQRYFKLNSIEEYKEIDLNDSKENILKIVRAFDFPGYEPAYFVVEGKKDILENGAVKSMEFTQTPIVYVENILGNRIYMKREDLLSFSFGGNKVRIAQEFFSDMKSKGCDCIIGYGNARSNLSRAIANMSAMEKVDCQIISPADNDGSRIDTGNSSIVQMCNVKIQFCEKNNVSKTVETVLNNCKKRGMNPYYIYGDKYGKGNEIVPLEAYRKVYEEIKEQAQIQFDYIFLAIGTGMTQGGLLVGRKSHGGQEKIVGISVAREKEQEKKVLKNMLDCYSQSRNMQSIDSDEIEICDDYLCGGYGKYNEELLITTKRMMREHGIPLDVTYTGKAYYGMKEYIESNSLKNKNILFIHTGGTPLFFDNLQAMIDLGEKDGR